MTKEQWRRIESDSLERAMEEAKRLPSMTSTVSAQECTGLFPRPPQGEAEYDSLRQMHGMETPRPRAGKAKG